MEAIRKDNLPLAGGYGGRLCGLELLQPLLHDKLSHSGDKANTQRRVRHRSRLPMIPWILYQTVVVEVLVIQSCFTLCNPMDCSLPGSFAHGILQERILEWVAMPSSRESSNPGMEPRSSALQADTLPFELPAGLQFKTPLDFLSCEWLCLLFLS